MPTTIQPTQLSAPQTVAQPQGSSILGKDDFLKLLTMQLQYQDPLNPLSGTEFAAQLAQFSSVEQLSNINTNLQQSIDANYVMTQSINNALAATFVGKDVRASTDTFQMSGNDDSTVRLGYSLSAPADSVTVKIYDESGNLVKTIVGTGTEQGDNTFTWDGTNDNGQGVGAGKYKFSVEAKDSSGGSVSATSFIYGTVSGVRFKADGTVFVVDGMEVKLSDILEIMEG
jgi:flagellar basal-body rod modification protein FlgD